MCIILEYFALSHLFYGDSQQARKSLQALTKDSTVVLTLLRYALGQPLVLLVHIAVNARFAVVGKDHDVTTVRETITIVIIRTLANE